VKHSERPFAYAIDWLFQRIAGEYILIMLWLSVIWFPSVFSIRTVAVLRPFVHRQVESLRS